MEYGCAVWRGGKSPQYNRSKGNSLKIVLVKVMDFDYWAFKSALTF